jgi:hypothetical protein
VRCKYCDKNCLGEYCNEKCRTEAIKFQQHAEKYAKLFLVLLLTPVLLVIPGFFFLDQMLLFVALMFFIMGVVIIIFPFTTPQTVDMVGVKKSLLLGRICGGICILMGVVFVAIQIVWM